MLRRFYNPPVPLAQHPPKHRGGLAKSLLIFVKNLTFAVDFDIIILEINTAER